MSDAWPGDFTEYGNDLGGKDIKSGHDFFRRLVAGSTRRGKMRQLCAQMYMLFARRREVGRDYLSNLATRDIDDFYHVNIDFDSKSEDARRFKSILDKAVQLLGDGKRPSLKGHAAMHVALLIDSLMDDFTREWESKFADAFDRFTGESVAAVKNKNKDPRNEFWTEYGQWTQTASAERDVIRKRHDFFTKKMIRSMSPLKRKDSQRDFSAAERDGFGHRRAWTFPCGMHFVLPEARCSRNNFHNSALHVALVPQSVSEDSNGDAGAETAPHRAGAAIVAT